MSNTMEIVEIIEDDDNIIEFTIKNDDFWIKSTSKLIKNALEREGKTYTVPIVHLSRKNFNKIANIYLNT